MLIQRVSAFLILVNIAKLISAEAGPTYTPTSCILEKEALFPDSPPMSPTLLSNILILISLLAKIGSRGGLNFHFPNE